MQIFRGDFWEESSSLAQKTAPERVIRKKSLENLEEKSADCSKSLFCVKWGFGSRGKWESGGKVDEWTSKQVEEGAKEKA
jgi:hypothetical protein